jgi:uncharacterized protein YrrD
MKEQPMDGEALRGMAVVSVQQAEKLGTIDDLLLDLPHHRLGGVMLRGGLFRGGPTLTWSAVRSVGKDAVTVDDSSALSDPGDTQPTDWVRLSTFRGTKVVTDTGDLLGTISGIDVDPQSGKVIHYVAAAPSGRPFSTGEQFIVSPAAVVGVGVGLLTVDTQQSAS